MKATSLLAILAISLFATRAQAIDFTPRYTETIDDGIPFRRMYFSDGTRRIFYRPPPTWIASGSSEAAVFRHKDAVPASVRIENTPAEQARIPFNEQGLEALRKFARTLVPPDTSEIVDRWEVVDPVVLHGWTSFEMGFDCVYSDQRWCRSVLFLNLEGNRRVHLIINARPNDFRKLYDAAHRSLATWWYRESE